MKFMIADIVVSYQDEITVYFTNAGATGLYIKNKDYVHFEVGNAQDVWVCSTLLSSLLTV